MNTFNARQNIIMAAAQHVPAKMILDSGAGISGVGEQWKLTDISRMSSMSIQGAFGDSMRLSIQGPLGREKLPPVLVPGMTDDKYSLSGLLNSNGATGAKDKVAIFTKNGAIILMQRGHSLSRTRRREDTHSRPRSEERRVGKECRP